MLDRPIGPAQEVAADLDSTPGSVVPNLSTLFSATQTAQQVGRQPFAVTVFVSPDDRQMRVVAALDYANGAVFADGSALRAAFEACSSEPEDVQDLAQTASALGRADRKALAALLTEWIAWRNPPSGQGIGLTPHGPITQDGVPISADGTVEDARACWRGDCGPLVGRWADALR